MEGLHRPRIRPVVPSSPLEVVDAGSPAVGRFPYLPAGLEGVVQDGWGAGEVDVVATASNVGARVIGAEHGTWNKDTRSKARAESSWAHYPVHQLWPDLITIAITLSRSPVQYDTVQYSTENFREVQQQNLNLGLNTRCNTIQYVNANKYQVSFHVSFSAHARTQWKRKRPGQICSKTQAEYTFVAGQFEPLSSRVEWERLRIKLKTKYWVRESNSVSWILDMSCNLEMRMRANAKN